MPAGTPASTQASQPRQTRIVAGEPGDQKWSRRVREGRRKRTARHLADVLPQPPTQHSKRNRSLGPHHGGLPARYRPSDTLLAFLVAVATVRRAATFS